MNLTMMASTEHDHRLVTDLSAECAALRKAEMMGIGRCAAADEACWVETNLRWTKISWGCAKAPNSPLSARSVCLWRRSVMPLRTYEYRKHFGAWLEVGDARFNSNEILRRYEADDYPLRKPDRAPARTSSQRDG